MIYSSKREHKKAPCHRENGRVMGQWLTRCLGPRDPWGNQGLATMSLPSEPLHYLWTLRGVHGPVIYGSPSGSVGILLLILRTRTPKEMESLRGDCHGWNRGDWRVVIGGKPYVGGLT